MTSADSKFTNANDAGFSLLELLVAVAVLALAAVTLLENQTGSLRIGAAVFERTLASVVAENRLVGLRLQPATPEPGIRRGQATQLSTTYRWVQTVRLMPPGDVLRFDIKVLSSNGKRELATLTGFRRAE